MVLCGLFAAITAVCAWISIPLGFTPVPVNLATLAVFIAGALLGPKYGSISMAVYALAGAVGVPVFAQFKAGLGVLAGPTGGYIIGYIAAAFVVGLIINTFLGRPAGGTDAADRSGGADAADRSAAGKRRSSIPYSVAIYVGAMICGLAACYALGTAWFMISTHTGFVAAMVMCVIPFLPGDALKIIAATLLARRLKKFI